MPKFKSVKPGGLLARSDAGLTHLLAFLPHCISTPIVYFSNSVTAGPKSGMKKEEGRTTKIILENLKRIKF